MVSRETSSLLERQRRKTCCSLGWLTADLPWVRVSCVVPLSPSFLGEGRWSLSKDCAWFEGLAFSQSMLHDAYLKRRHPEHNPLRKFFLTQAFSTAMTKKEREKKKGKSDSSIQPIYEGFDNRFNNYLRAFSIVPTWMAKQLSPSCFLPRFLATLSPIQTAFIAYLCVHDGRHRNLRGALNPDLPRTWAHSWCLWVLLSMPNALCWWVYVSTVDSLRFPSSCAFAERLAWQHWLQ